jgi:hypothetical protein
MLTCENCIHSSVCTPYNTPNYEYPNIGDCPHFKDKADYVEVKHGYWKQTKEPLGVHDVDCIECSVCGESWVVDEDFDFEDCTKNWSFCPNCGAKMDGERKESEVRE